MEYTIPLWEKEEYSYPCAGDFIPNMMAHLHEDEQVRPAILVVPGGGYRLVSPTEGELVAKRFYDAGYQAFVLNYTTNMFQLATLNKQPLRDISRAVRHLRHHAEKLHIDERKVVCCGFSAGAHLAGTMAVHYQDDALKSEPFSELSNRPDAVLLCYPVITSGEKAAGSSFTALLGENADEASLAWASLEKHVTPDTPPAFLWQTLTDESVPVENSILYTEACRKAGVPCELHLFMEGPHGLSVADEDWAAGNFGENSICSLTQLWQTMRILSEENPSAIPTQFAEASNAESLTEFAAEWNKAAPPFPPQENDTADPSASQWFPLSLAWLEKIFSK